MKKKSELQIDEYGNKWWYLNGKKVKKEDVIINAYLTEKEYLDFVINL